MPENKPKKRKTHIKRSFCRLCRELCEPNKILWNRDFREKVQDITCMWIKVSAGFRKYHVCSSCQKEVEVYYSFKKRCRQLLHGEMPLPQTEDNDDSDLMLDSLLQNCSDEVILSPDVLDSLGSATGINTSAKEDDLCEELAKTKDHDKASSQPKPRKKQHKTKQKPVVSDIDPSEAASEVQTQSESVDDDLQPIKPAKKIRPYRRRFRQTEEEKAMSQEEYLQYYKKMVPKSYKSVCDICGKTINSHRMESHMNRHNGVQPYSCEECGLQFHCRFNMMKHINRSHAKGHEITCEICQKVSVSLIAHKQHVRAVHQERRFQCTLCPVKAVTQHALNKHMDIHNQRRDFVCPHCGKAFYRRYVLNIHLRTHSGETPYKCHVCAEEAFVHRRIYVMHMKKHHPDEPLMRVDSTRALKEALMQKDFG